jgi:hypothetical protein
MLDSNLSSKFSSASTILKLLPQTQNQIHHRKYVQSTGWCVFFFTAFISSSLFHSSKGVSLYSSLRSKLLTTPSGLLGGLTDTVGNVGKTAGNTVGGVTVRSLTPISIHYFSLSSRFPTKFVPLLGRVEY